ncbi:carbohydrate sulfotransferase 14-like [Dendronephthya gigantea]|uniref:carbohydrate sulfotransferase 14-like n=1 Tax=Dendronephthya gigantea TaxID=151771 RepID=UPI00106DA925|nr:carbohydrate sulfotransferase 14-like [Dendronephthya gigantea]
MRRQYCQWFVIFLLLIFTFTGYWFGRRSCFYEILDRNLYTNQEPEKANTGLRLKTAKFEREARKYALQKCCRPTSLSAQELKNVLKHVIVDRKNKLLYCYIPKVASSNMKRLILTLQNFTEDSNAIRYFDQRGFEFLGDVSPQDRKHMLDTYFKFLFVRNPFVRMVSAYRNKFHGKNVQFQIRIGKDIVRKYRKPSIPINEVKGDDVAFQEFVKYLIDKNNDLQTMNEHWMPMYELCQPCHINYDFIGSFENLDFDINALLARLHASKSVTFPRKQSHYGNPITKKEIEGFFQNIAVDDYISLYKRYLNDFKCFNYKFTTSKQMLN